MARLDVEVVDKAGRAVVGDLVPETVAVVAIGAGDLAANVDLCALFEPEDSVVEKPGNILRFTAVAVILDDVGPSGVGDRAKNGKSEGDEEGGLHLRRRHSSKPTLRAVLTVVVLSVEMRRIEERTANSKRQTSLLLCHFLGHPLDRIQRLGQGRSHVREQGWYRRTTASTHRQWHDPPLIASGKQDEARQLTTT